MLGKVVMSFFTVLRIESSDGNSWGHLRPMAGSNSGMQNNNIGLAPLVNCPVCPVHYVTELQMRPGSARRGQRSLVGPGRILRLWPCFSGPGRTVF